MNKPLQLVQFTLDEQRYALVLSALDRIVRSIAITPLPKAPPIILGIINVQGSIVPVVNMRGRFRVREKEQDIHDQMIIAKTQRRRVAFLADGTAGVLEYPEESIIGAAEISPQVAYLRGVAKLEDGLLLIHDLDTFLSLDEHRALDQALH
ncbi:MAG: purine-binding chemotaxis protein CheW [Ignavibacteriales bacterium]|nr:purine-binding chemotaxis protein CheW [Ignavibacteriales bacterium]